MKFTHQFFLHEHRIDLQEHLMHFQRSAKKKKIQYQIKNVLFLNSLNERFCDQRSTYRQDRLKCRCVRDQPIPMIDLYAGVYEVNLETRSTYMRVCTRSTYTQDRLICGCVRGQPIHKIDLYASVYEVNLYPRSTYMRVCTRPTYTQDRFIWGCVRGQPIHNINLYAGVYEVNLYPRSTYMRVCTRST